MHFQQNYWPVSSKSSVQNTARVLLSYSVSVCIAINSKVHVFNDLIELSQQAQTLSQETFEHSTGVINKMNEFSLVPPDSSSDSSIPLILINVSTLTLELNRSSHQNKTLVAVVVNGSKCFCKPCIHSRLYVSWAVNQINISTKPVLSCSHCMFMTKLSCHEAEGTGAELHAVQPVSTVQVSVSTFLSVKPFDISDEGPGRFNICKRDIIRYF